MSSKDKQEIKRKADLLNRLMDAFYRSPEAGKDYLGTLSESDLCGVVFCKTRELQEELLPAVLGCDSSHFVSPHDGGDRVMVTFLTRDSKIPYLRYILLTTMTEHERRLDAAETSEKVLLMPPQGGVN